MSRGFRFIPALGAVLFAAVGLSACGGIPGNAVVQVGSNSITESAFDHWMGVASASSTQSESSTGKAPLPEPPNYTACIAHLKAIAPAPGKGESPPTQALLKSECQQRYTSLQQEVLGFLISSEWVLGEANSLGVKVSDAEVRKRFEQVKNEQFPTAAEFKKFLESSGETVSDLLLRVKLNLLSTKIQQKVVKSKGTVTEADITKYYNDNPEHFTTPEKRNVLIILTKTEAAATKAKQEISSGKSFASVAKAVSTDPTTKNTGGVLNGVVKGEEEKGLNEAIFTASKNVLTGPVHTEFGYYIVEVTGTFPGSKQTLAAAKSSIKQQLTATQQQSALSTFVKEFKKRWMGKTNCRSGYVVSDCKQYKAPKTTTTVK